MSCSERIIWSRGLDAIRDSRIATRQQVGALDDLRLDSRALAFAIRVAKFNWDPKVPFDQFDARSINNARTARENEGYREQFLAWIRDRLGTAAVKGQALHLCQELFLADGARSDEEDAVLQNLRQLLE
jgi:hypothetical protein